MSVAYKCVKTVPLLWPLPLPLPLRLIFFGFGLFQCFFWFWSVTVASKSVLTKMLKEKA